MALQDTSLIWKVLMVVQVIGLILSVTGFASPYHVQGKGRDKIHMGLWEACFDKCRPVTDYLDALRRDSTWVDVSKGMMGVSLGVEFAVILLSLLAIAITLTKLIGLITAALAFLSGTEIEEFCHWTNRRGRVPNRGQEALREMVLRYNGHLRVVALRLSQWSVAVCPVWSGAYPGQQATEPIIGFRDTRQVNVGDGVVKWSEQGVRYTTWLNVSKLTMGVSLGAELIVILFTLAALKVNVTKLMGYTIASVAFLSSAFGLIGMTVFQVKAKDMFKELTKDVVKVESGWSFYVFLTGQLLYLLCGLGYIFDSIQRSR